MVATLPSEPRSRWRRGCAALVAIALIALVGTCGAGLLAVRRGAFALQWFDTNVAGIRVVGYTTWNANCPPFTGCAPTISEAYVVWLADGQHTWRVAWLPIE